MFKNERVNQLMLFAAVVVLILLTVFNKPNSPIFEIPPVKHIETRIEGKESEITVIHEYIGNEKKIIAELSSKFDLLMNELEVVKNKRDTFQIVQIQDTIISSLSLENRHLYHVIDSQDSIIVAQRYIINSKDTLIAIGEHNLKRVKKHRNLSLVFNGILTGIVVFK